ncbi:MAG: hypothetical protein PUB39_06685 [Eubacteriales bacterium]|nr:hypothetical protein [Eubacteriales bacterium]
MSRRFTKITVLMLAVVMAFTVSACGAKSSGGSSGDGKKISVPALTDKDKITNTVSDSLEALKTFDTKVLEKNVDGWDATSESLTEDSGFTESEIDGLLKNIFGHLKYKITKVEKTDSKNATATVKVTNVNMGPVVKNWSSAIISYSIEHNNETREQIMKAAIPMLKEQISKSWENGDTVDNTLKFKLKKSGGKWIMDEITGDQTDALSGGFMTAIQNM